MTSNAKTEDTDEQVRKLSKQVSELQMAISQCQKELKNKVEVPPATSTPSATIDAHQPQPGYAYVTSPWNTQFGSAQPQPVPSAAWTASPSQVRTTMPQEGPQPPLRGDQQPSDPRGCYSCGQLGHFRRSCPNRRNTGSKAAGADVKHITGPDHPAEVYLRAQLGDKSINCLLDTGSEISLIGRRLIPNEALEPTTLKLYAANDTAMPILGRVKLKLRLGELEVETEFIVSDNLEEVILGYEWLSQHNCLWNFTRNSIQIDGVSFQLRRRQTKAYVRRIYVDQDSAVPAHHQANIPVKVMRHNPYATSPNWVVEPKSVVPGVITARTLLSEDAPCVAVRVLNCTGDPVQLSKDVCVGTALPAQVFESVLDVEMVDSGLNSSKRTGNSRGAQPLSATVGNSYQNPDQCRQQPETTENDVGNFTDLPESGAYEEHLQPLYQSLPSDLSDEERLRAEQFIRDNETLFSKSEFDIGRTDLVQHRIDTGTHRPFRQSLRRHPVAHLPQIDQHVDEMLRHDIIEPAASPWCSNVVLIRKADGGLRFCIDYRQLNELTYKDAYPLPKIDMCLSALGGSQFFSTIDLRAGYWQTSIDERDRDNTCFVTRRGTFRFKVLSFGLANAPALFQRLMDLVLVGLTWDFCLFYLDDVIIMSETFDEHLSRLTAVFNRLQSANLKLKPAKCRLFQRRVIFLGHLVTAEGIAADPSKIQAVQNWP